MKQLITLTLLLAALAAAQTWPGKITYSEGQRYNDSYSSIAVVNGDTVYVRAAAYQISVGDTISVHWLPQGDADLAGYNLIYIGATTRSSIWLPLASVKIDTMVSASRKLYLDPGYYYLGVDAQDTSGNRSALSVAIMLRVNPAGLLPPRIVHVIISSLAN